MNLYRQQRQLNFDGFDVETLAEIAGTPVYVYSWSRIEEQLKKIRNGLSQLDYRIHYAVKANSNLALLHRLQQCDVGFDVVSEGELSKVLHAGGDPKSVVFSGVGKSREELAFALKIGLGCINVESIAELDRLIQIANHLNISGSEIAIRINPSVSLDSHKRIVTGDCKSKFGVFPDEIDEVVELLQESSYLTLSGLTFHLGSEIHLTQPYKTALEILLGIANHLNSKGFSVTHLNIGGGFAIPKQNSEGFPFKNLAQILRETLAGKELTIRIEPGRFILGSAGILITKVEYLKERHGADRPTYVIVNAGMNDCMRPMLYGAQHRVYSIKATESNTKMMSVAGPICESTDIFCTDYPLATNKDDLLVIDDVGAYGFSLSSNYNTRPRCAELLLENGEIQIIRERETIYDLYKLEQRVQS